MRNFKLIISGLIILSYFSFKRESVKDKIVGVWFSEYSINTLFSNKTFDNSERFFNQSFPVVYDFKENGDLLLKNFRGNDTIVKWSLKSNSILTINKLDFHIHYLTHDSINLVYADKNSYREFSYIRPRDIKIKESKNEIENILLSNIWTTNDTAYKEIREHFEFLDNQTMIYRYKNDVEYDSISPENLQLETWGIAKYKNYAFLYNYLDMKIGNGYNKSINQIVEINANSYSTLNSFDRNKSTSFLSKKTTDNKEAIKRIQGNWISMNSKKESYGLIPRSAIKAGRIELYQGKLHLMINKDSLSFKINELKPQTYNWQLSKDGKILIFEYKIDEPERKGIHVDCADILELTEKKLKIRLFNIFYYTGLPMPQEYRLNLIQEFEKID